MIIICFACIYIYVMRKKSFYEVDLHFSLCHSLRPFMSLALIKNMGSNLTACLK